MSSKDSFAKTFGFKIQSFFVENQHKVFIVKTLTKFILHITAIIYLHLHVFDQRDVTNLHRGVCVIDRAGACHSPRPVVSQ